MTPKPVDRRRDATPRPVTAAAARHRSRGRHRTTGSSRARALPRPTRRTTVWPCADGEQLAGTARLAGWLARTIITTVTAYTVPGQRVLLLAPPPSATRPRTDSSVGGWRTHNPYTGLHEAAWTVVRLGRSVDTATASPPAATAVTSRQAPESGSGRRPAQLGLHTPISPDPHRRAERTEPTGRGEDRFHLVITAVPPRPLDWVRTTDWSRLLTPSGTLAIVTHSNREGSRFIGPVSALVTTFRHCGLGWLDHVIVLTAPPQPAAQTGAVGRASGNHANADAVGGDALLGGHRGAHHDLLLLVADPAVEDDGRGEASRSHA
ncbi:hypothetical protein FHX69_0216 [Prauserella muralis]|nr:hypothetical protein FHX69_0216 [Prauserella muralis]